MSELIDKPLTAADYDRLADEYYQTLPMEHFMESFDHAEQRRIAWESLSLLHARRPDVQVFNETLIQYRVKGRVRRVVPDNMVRMWSGPPTTKKSYNIELEPVAPLWVLEWVSSSSEGKDYGDAFRKYERDLKILYCLSFNPDKKDFRIYRHDGERYQAVAANDANRHPLPELDLEVGLLHGWVRFWHQGELLEITDEYQVRVDELQGQAVAAKRLAQQEKRRANEEKRRAEEEKRRAEEEKRRADDANRRAEEEERGRVAAEQEVARLRALLSPPRSGG